MDRDLVDTLSNVAHYNEKNEPIPVGAAKTVIISCHVSVKHIKEVYRFYCNSE